MGSFYPLVEGAEAKLNSQLSLFRRPCDRDLVSPILRKDCRKDSPDLARYLLAEQVWDACRLGQLPMWLRDVEVHQRSKHGSFSRRSGYSDSMESVVDRYFSAPPRKWWCPAAARHASRVLRSRVLRKGHARLVPLDLEVAAGTFEGRTSYGWPVLSSKPEWFTAVLDLSRDLLDHLGDMELAEKFPAVLGSRGQPAGLNRLAKARAVWGCSRVIGNLEKMVFVPVFDALAVQINAWRGQRSVDSSITRMFGMATPTTPLMSVDFSNFDASVPLEVVNRQFDLLAEWFEPSATQLIRFLQRHFTRVALWTPSGLREGRTGGIPSGSVLTNLIGSMANMWVVEYAAYMVDGNSVKECQVQGDDGVYAFQKPMDTDALSAVLSDHFSMTLSVDKSLIADREVHFLQNVHRASYRDIFNTCVGVRPVMRVLNGMMSYERLKPHWCDEMDTLRWMQQMETASAHPCFRAFVEWFAATDVMAKVPVGDLIAGAGGLGIVSQTLGGGPWMNKIQAEALPKSRVAQVLRSL